MSIRVLIADDQSLVRAGFRLVLENHDDIEVVGEASNGHEAIHGARRLEPDVVLMDIRMPELDGIEATREITARHPARVLVLTTYDLDEYVYDALQAGARGFLLKDAPPAQLADGIRAVAARRGAARPDRHAPADRGVRPPRPAGRARPPELDELTPRELEVLWLLARGLSNAEIAAQFVLGETTIKTHVAHLLAEARRARSRPGGRARLRVGTGDAGAPRRVGRARRTSTAAGWGGGLPPTSHKGALGPVDGTLTANIAVNVTRDGSSVPRSDVDALRGARSGPTLTRQQDGSGSCDVVVADHHNVDLGPSALPPCDVVQAGRRPRLPTQRG